MLLFAAQPCQFGAQAFDFGFGDARAFRLDARAIRLDTGALRLDTGAYRLDTGPFGHLGTPEQLLACCGYEQAQMTLFTPKFQSQRPTQ